MRYGLRSWAAALIKRPLNALGFDIVRLSRGPANGHEPAHPQWPARSDIFDVPEENKLKWLRALEIRTVIDVGAHRGGFTNTMHEVLPDARILSFEPVSHVFEQLVQNMTGVPKFTAFRLALGDQDGETDMWRNEFDPSSSLLPMAELHKTAFPFTKQETAEKVAVRRLDDVVRGLDLEENILVKLDVQGYEDRVIRGGDCTIGRARLLIVETSFQTLYEGQPLFDDIYCLLRQKGFKYIGNWDDLRNPIDGSVLQADALFANERQGPG